MTDPESPEADAERLRRSALSRWENEGGTTGTAPSSASSDASPPDGIEVDAATVAAGLGLDTAQFRTLMREGKITHLTERGIDADAGLWRVTFHYQARRVRLVVDAMGTVVDRD